MLVRIIEKETKKVIGTFPVVTRGENYDVDYKDYCDLAWTAAIEDRVVAQDSRESYEFELVLR